ncbi:RimK family alpha-L-glutamate ligase [Myxococcota bacterium]|nr:RimK family alpha-L-glutamate ligase [Myxococcota bacterium]
MSPAPPRLYVLTRRPDVPTTRRLLEGAIAAGLDTILLDDRRCEVRVGADGATVTRGGAPLPAPSAVLARGAPTLPSFALTLMRAFRDGGAWLINPPGPLSRARDKLRAVHRLAAAGIPVPDTAWPSRASDLDALVASLGGPPVVIKTLRGSQGAGVCRADSIPSARSVIEAFFATRTPIVVQRWIGEADGVDRRALVVGGRVVAAMERRARSGEFRANFHRGSECRAVDLSPEEAATALAAARVMGLHVAGVDLLQSAKGPVVLEVNASPGLVGIEGATGRDLAGEIARDIAAGIAVRTDARPDPRPSRPARAPRGRVP